MLPLHKRLLVTFIILIFFFNGEVVLGQDENTSVFDSILSLFKQYNIVHIGERHWNLKDFKFRVQLINHPRFPEIVNDVIIESGNYLYQNLLDDYVLKLKKVPEKKLCRVWRNTVVTTGVWDATIYKDFIYAVRKVNNELPEKKRIRLIASEPPIDWSAVNSWEELQPFFCARSTHTPKVIMSEVVMKKRKALIIYGGAHFYRSSNVISMPGRLRTLLERLMGEQVFTILPLGGTDSYSQRFQETSGIKKYPYFVNLKTSKLARLKGDLFFGEAEGELGDFTDGILYFGLQQNMEATYDPAAANDPIYQKELERRQRLLEQDD